MNVRMENYYRVASCGFNNKKKLPVVVYFPEILNKFQTIYLYELLCFSMSSSIQTTYFKIPRSLLNLYQTIAEN